MKKVIILWCCVVLGIVNIVLAMMIGNWDRVQGAFMFVAYILMALMTYRDFKHIERQADILRTVYESRIARLELEKEEQAIMKGCAHN